MKFDIDVNVLLRMNGTNFGDPLTFHLAASAFHLSLMLWYMTK